MTTSVPLEGLRDRDRVALSDLRKYLYFRIGGEDAAARAAARRAGDAVVAELKAASPATTTTALSSPFAQALTRLIAENTQPGPFETMRPLMTQVPLRTRVLVSTATIAASEVSEASAKPVRRLSLTNLDTEVSKFVAMIAVSKEFLDMAPALAQRLLADALPEAVGRAVDTYFLAKLNAINSGESDSEVDPSFTNMLEDLEELLRLVRVGQRSRLFFILPPRGACLYRVCRRRHHGEIQRRRDSRRAAGSVRYAGYRDHQLG
jgi:hypothetical protein